MQFPLQQSGLLTVVYVRLAHLGLSYFPHPITYNTL